MSISTTLSSINQTTNEITRLEKALLDETKKEADITKKINNTKKSITKNTSVSTVNSKLGQIERYENDLVKTLNKKTDITKKIAQKREKLNSLNKKLKKEEQDENKKRQKEQERVQKSYEKRIDELTAQLKNNISSNISEVGKSTSEETSLEEKYDVFISHASEDKESFVRELADTLIEEYNIKVWYDEFSIKWGDSLRKSIDKGLKSSKFGIVVISKSFIKKGWTNYELDGLFQKEMTYGKTILPIWHDITKDEVQDFSPSLAGRKALNTSMYTIKEIAEELKNILSE
ncbi:toll/interleukin-1 receptor domain-containing protein [Tissierella praeacuta]|uniref:toll/interleukin-1 receptor domain-containing protein n=1 Tax=Tissierella praeacuta TaxID=43131 RepID=UPI001C10F106|nr:toll/interleukin-1 receptor domain-containing protein [Tissierella praeacuta]MBU5257571.1 TIR domain-containing protein [Tissierella praeacuta]